MNENRPQRSACSTDSSRKPSPSPPTSFTNAETGVSRSASTSRHTGTTVWSRASVRNSSSDGWTSWRSPAQTRPGWRPSRRPGRSTSARRCGTRREPSCSTTKRRRRRRSRSTPPGRTGGRPTSRPCTRTPGGSGSRTRSGPLEGLAAATPRSSRRTSGPGPVASSCTMAGTSPSAFKATAAISSGRLDGGRDRGRRRGHGAASVAGHPVRARSGRVRAARTVRRHVETPSFMDGSPRAAARAPPPVERSATATTASTPGSGSATATTPRSSRTSRPRTPTPTRVLAHTEPSRSGSSTRSGARPGDRRLGAGAQGPVGVLHAGPSRARSTAHCRRPAGTRLPDPGPSPEAAPDETVLLDENELAGDSTTSRSAGFASRPTRLPRVLDRLHGR